MGRGCRSLLFEQDGSIRKLSRRLTNDLVHGKATLPEYADQSLRHADVHIWTDEKRIPIDIDYLSLVIFHFDENGSIQSNLAKAAFAARLTHEDIRDQDKSADVVDVTPHIKQKQWFDEHTWKPSQVEYQSIIGIIFGSPPKN